MNGELMEFSSEWPKPSQRPLKNIDKLMREFGIDRHELTNHDDQSMNSESGSLKGSKKRSAGRPALTQKRVKVGAGSSTVRKVKEVQRQLIQRKANGQKTLRLAATQRTRRTG